MKSKKLELSKETVRKLTPEEAQQAAGGGVMTLAPCPTVFPMGCPTLFTACFSVYIVCPVGPKETQGE